MVNNKNSTEYINFMKQMRQYEEEKKASEIMLEEMTFQNRVLEEELAMYRSRTWYNYLWFNFITLATVPRRKITNSISTNLMKNMTGLPSRSSQLVSNSKSNLLMSARSPRKFMASTSSFSLTMPISLAIRNNCRNLNACLRVRKIKRKWRSLLCYVVVSMWHLDWATLKRLRREAHICSIQTKCQMVTEFMGVGTKNSRLGPDM